MIFLYYIKKKEYYYINKSQFIQTKLFNTIFPRVPGGDAGKNSLGSFGVLGKSTAFQQLLGPNLRKRSVEFRHMLEDLDLKGRRIPALQVKSQVYVYILSGFSDSGNGSIVRLSMDF